MQPRHPHLPLLTFHLYAGVLRDLFHMPPPPLPNDEVKKSYELEHGSEQISYKVTRTFWLQCAEGNNL